ncbi:MAG TPA: carbon monoxide dehydrogenase subunit G [Rhizomicrobium sp.]|nr:carbon monoxide dehydrogenase subunit G [Rhizomicrobium sp.]
MDFTGRYLIPARPQVVWTALNDPEVLRACVPGCQSLERTDDTHFAAVATLKIGPVKATFKANIALTEMDPPHRCLLKGEGQGGVAGFARGEAEVLLVAEGDETALSYTAKASVGGKLAQIGQRLIDGAARQIADDFFSRFAAALTPKVIDIEEGEMIAISPEFADAMTRPTSLPADAPDAPDGKPVERREGVAPEIWVVGLIGVIVILLVLFGVTL